MVAGGIGLAPLRPLLLDALAERAAYRKIVLVAGARPPDEFLFRAELDRWAARDNLDVELTVDRPAAGSRCAGTASSGTSASWSSRRIGQTCSGERTVRGGTTGNCCFTCCSAI
ncbi:hypothetical protein AB0E63_21740 [Kribbella sp. NPDC026596]|uniref:hypothetical protein n=1 Tax=Kribbella sp. NPDC026596 TaxID=3155122 RepID=UPI0033CAE0D4